MGTTKDLIYSIESRRDINCVRLSYRVYERLSDKDQLAFWVEFKETPEEGPYSLEDGRIRPIRWAVADMALFIYARNKKQTSLHNAFRIAKKYRHQLWKQHDELVRKLNHYTLGDRDKYIAKQFLFHGFVPLADFRGIKEADDCTAYITSSRTLNGVTYIFPKRLSMSARPRKGSDKKHLWYQFEGHIGLPGYTRAWYTNEVKFLNKAQDDQRKTF